MRCMVAIVVAALAWGGAANAGVRLSFRDSSEEVKALSLAELQNMAAPEEIRVFEPHEEAEISFAAMPLAPLLDGVFGKRWRKSEYVVFVCADGYQKAVTPADLAENPGWLAYSRKASVSFALNEQKPTPRVIQLAPLFLLRDEGRDLAAKRQNKTSWPFQIVSVRLSTFAELFAGLAPPKAAPTAAQRGFHAFGRYCVSCHSLNGDGGKVGPELNAPVSVTVYYKTPWLKKWIARPSSIRAGTPMPAVIPEGSDQARTIDDIVAYLSAKAGT